ncbi:MAG: hypothetical protein ABMB14_11300 [Myxococcota bacterium]
MTEDDRTDHEANLPIGQLTWSVTAAALLVGSSLLAEQPGHAFAVAFGCGADAIGVAILYPRPTETAASLAAFFLLFSSVVGWVGNLAVLLLDRLH